MADLAFLWHMHQPDYRHPESGEFVLPWVLLHAIKDYADMASHLERHPGVRCTVNFVPVLLDQIEDYCEQLASGQWRDPLLRSVAHPDPETLPAGDRAWLLDMAFRCHAPTMLEPFAPYRRLRDLYQFARALDANALSYLAGTYYSDLATWFLLAWTGEGLRRERHAVPELMAKGGNFDLADRQRLLAKLGDVLHKLIPRYRALSERGQIELSCTPASHPLAPLLIDFKAARESWPESPLPMSTEYPGGRSRVEAHLAAARASHERRFGQAPAGLWPAEGALSAPFLNQIGEAGFTWTASSHGVLRHSAGERAPTTQPWLAPEGTPGDLTLFFRNEKLSDLIGFEYANWHGRNAAKHFMREVTAQHAANPEAMVTVFLDGENAWEYYSVQRLVLLYRPLRRARAAQGHPHRDLERSGRRAAPASHAPDRRQLGLRHAVDVDLQPRQEPRLGPAVLGQAVRRPRPAGRPHEPRGALRGAAAADGLREFGLVLVAWRLQLTTVGRLLRPAVLRQRQIPLPPAAPAGPRQPRPPAQLRRRHPRKRRHDAPRHLKNP